MADATTRVLAEVAAERQRQDAKWGPVGHLSIPDGTGPDRTWIPGLLIRADDLRDVFQARTDQAAERGRVTLLDIALEEVAEAFAEQDAETLRAEVIQCAAVFVKWAEAIDQREAGLTASDEEAAGRLARSMARVRQERRLTQQQVADALHISRTAVSEIERGQREMSAVEALAAARLFGLPVGVLLGESRVVEP